ncbi:hypothetical protein ACNPM8_16685, partial [Glutamicibacter sp. AGC46]
ACNDGSLHASSFNQESSSGLGQAVKYKPAHRPKGGLCRMKIASTKLLRPAALAAQFHAGSLTQLKILGVVFEPHSRQAKE